MYQCLNLQYMPTTDANIEFLGTEVSSTCKREETSNEETQPTNIAKRAFKTYSATCYTSIMTIFGAIAKR